MASTSSTIPAPPPLEVTFCALGRPVPSSSIPRDISDAAFEIAQQHFNNIVPTTYEASKEYLDEEMLKPKGQRDLRREMCMITVMEIPGNQDILLKFDAAKLLIPLTKGAMLFYPTVDLPPTAFGTPGNRRSNKLVDRKTGKPGQATIIMAYFSRTGDTHDYIGNIGNTSSKVHFGSLPFE
ncbi:hypothetical protein PILCRDRAFT_824224 [Piloderma croceum F 1598]|uniref:Uncharacterized protein n=1 Tax=Piloderma croceum (strain F 1598) TaxID=765440 RepID=A0A0C3F1I6_PILCF|nr:hypothetical protein PILCRDRAFT_824224 [Piloderma croceum F 1598]